MRAAHIDVARALCIALVVLGHSELAKTYSALNTALTSVRMPLFLILAGTFFKPDVAPMRMASAKAEGLLKPYLTMAALLAPYHLLTHPQDSLSHYVAGVLTFNGPDMPGWLFPMWFLTLLWTLHVGCSVFIRLTQFERNPPAHRLCWIIILLIAGYRTLDVFAMPNGPLQAEPWISRGLPFNLDLWLVSAAFFLTGALFRPQIRNWQTGLPPTLMATTIFVACQVKHAPYLELFDRLASTDLILTTVSALSGSFALIGWSHLLSRSRAMTQILAPFGAMSLYILLFHAPIQSVLGKQMRQLLPQYTEAATWLAWLTTLLLCVMAAKLIRLAPAMQMWFEHVQPNSAQRATVSAIRSLPAPMQVAEDYSKAA